MYNERAIKQYQQARTFHQKGNFSAAERAYKKALKINPDFVEAYNNLANAYLDSGRFNKAFIEYQKALKLLPPCPGSIELSARMPAMPVRMLIQGMPCGVWAGLWKRLPRTNARCN
jgi:tetratricopeptide (TPR) repeat protein